MNVVGTRKPPERPETYNFSPNGETKVLGFAGKIAAGKSSACNFLHALCFQHLLVDENGNRLCNGAYVNDYGKLILLNEKNEHTYFDLSNTDPIVVDHLNQYVWPFIRKFSCADPLKMMCMEILGLDPKLLWGTQEDKKTLTNLYWENMAGVDESKSGQMSVRDVLEYVGSNIFRKMSPDCLVDALVRSITNYGSLHSVIDDIRFVNELEGVRKIGKVIKLTRVSEEAANNNHISNCALDDVPDSEYDAVIDNANLDMNSSFMKLIEILTNWKWFGVVDNA
jgi:hypothetical protein